ncbi:MAG: hypothetical protein COC23_00215 [Hyphomicrobiales bacterium]|nr:MAG: hypothetical protein COC23_00215 [Hyphomicrobiales bacterium]
MTNAERMRSEMTRYTGTPRDFDFFAGRWNIRNRRLKHRNVGSDDWDEFEASQTAWIMLGGVANVDEFDCPARGFKGMSMRTLDLKTHQWSIYWINSTSGRLLNPVIGGFNGTHGLFFGDEMDADVPIISRFEWLVHPSTPTWKQSYSWDGGATWEVNWIMNLTRV